MNELQVEETGMHEDDDDDDDGGEHTWVLGEEKRAGKVGGADAPPSSSFWGTSLLSSLSLSL